MMNLLQKYKRETKAKCQSCEIEGEVMEKFSKGDIDRAEKF
jgi:hypothetical protein